MISKQFQSISIRFLGPINEKQKRIFINTMFKWEGSNFFPTSIFKEVHLPYQQAKLDFSSD